MHAPILAQQLASLPLYLDRRAQAEHLQARHARHAIHAAVARINNPDRSDFVRFVASPLAITAAVLTLPCEPMAVAVDYVGAVSAKGFGYTLGLVPATMGVIAGLASGNPDYVQRVPDNFLSTLTFYERSARIVLQAVPITLCVHGVEIATAGVCGVGRLAWDLAERQLIDRT